MTDQKVKRTQLRGKPCFLSDLSIKRPVLITMLITVFLVFGTLGVRPIFR